MAFEAFTAESVCNAGDAVQSVELAGEYPLKSYSFSTQIEKIHRTIFSRDDLMHFLGNYQVKMYSLWGDNNLEVEDCYKSIVRSILEINPAEKSFAGTSHEWATHYRGNEERISTLASNPLVVMLMTLRLNMGKILLVVKDLKELSASVRTDAPA